MSVFAAVNHQPYLAQPRRQGEHNAQNQGYGSVNAQFHILQLPPHLGADADGEGQQATQDKDNKGRLHAETNSVGNLVYPIGHFQRARKKQVAPLARRKRPAGPPGRRPVQGGAQGSPAGVSAAAACRPETRKSLSSNKTLSVPESWGGHRSAFGVQTVSIG